MAEEKNCEVHGQTLRPQTASITYGLFTPDRELSEARAMLFPHSHLQVNGGCCVGEEGFTREMLVCPECREAELKWRGANGTLNKFRWLDELFSRKEG